VPEKGAGAEWTAKQVCRDLVKLGIGGKVVLKADQEPALVSLIESIIKLRGGDITVPEYSPVGESQANGKAERGVQTIEGLVRTHLIELEGKLGMKVSVETPIFTWLVEHAADIHNKYHVFADGKTGYEKVKGRRYKGEMLEFGQAVLHKIPGKPIGGLMSTRWLPGTWIGKRFSSEEHVIAMPNGKVVRSRAVRSLPEKSMWIKEDVANVVGVPWRPAGEPIDDVLPDVPRAVEVHTEEPEEDAKVRGMKILPKHLVKVGYTKGCRKCAALRSGQRINVSLAHSSQCRTRIEEELKLDEELKGDVERAVKRKDEYISRKIEKSEEESATKKPRQDEEVQDVEVQPSKSEPSGGEAGGASGSGEVEAMDVPVPDDDDGDIVLEDAVGDVVEKRKREEGDDGGDEAPPTQFRQMNPRDDKRVREEDGTPGAEKAARTNEREAYARDLRKLERESDVIDFLGITEKQARRSGRSDCDVAEIFSPPRTTVRASQRGFKGGWALDCAHTDPWTGRKWDLRDPMTQEAAKNLLRKTKPKLLIASPPCTLFSQMLNISGGVKDWGKFEEAVKMVEFAVEMCLMQHRAGRHFVFEHPAGASSWRLPCLAELREIQGVDSTTFNMCQFGMVLSDKDGPGLVYKPTRACSNSGALIEKVSRRCQGGHRHVHLESGRAKLAAKYPEGLCDAFVDAMAMEDLRRGNVEEVLFQMAEYPDMCDPVEEATMRESLIGIDDNTGEELDPVLIRKARSEEMGGFKEFGVYEYVLREVAMKDSRGKFIGTRWVDVNKGTRKEPNVRSRLVGQEFAHGEVRDDLFAATPPLVASRMLLSTLASRGRDGPGDHRILLLDVKKAFLYGKIQRVVYIELPTEDEESKSGKYVGRLVKAMYGTRDAPQVWQEEVKNTMSELGFRSLVSTPCVYYNPDTGVRVVAHVDDFLVTGPKAELEKLQRDMSKRYQMKGQMLGPEPGEDKEGKFLGRTIRWKKEGLEWQGDQKLKEQLMKEWNIEKGSGVGTPGVKEERKVEGAEVALNDKKRIAKFRRAAAQINYMTLDNPMLGFASKEISRGMAAPTEDDERKVKRLIRYMRISPGVVYKYRWQNQPQKLSGFADSDWAGCVKTRRSTSGGIVMAGSHLLAHWSRTQVGVALSSGEAELNAALKAACEVIGVKVMSSEMELHFENVIYGDSSAAKGTLARQGSGKVKHLDTKQLWLQEKIKKNELEYIKIPRSQNLSDALTHHWTVSDGAQHFARMNVETITSCSESAIEGGC